MQKIVEKLRGLVPRMWWNLSSEKSKKDREK
jgi:hypothetical protein